MKYQFLTMYDLFKSHLSRLFTAPKTADNDSHFDCTNGYRLIADLTPHESEEKNRVGLYTTQTGKEVIIKKHHFDHKDIDYRYILNEARFLRMIKKIDGGMVEIPELIELVEAKQCIAMVSEKKNGVMIAELPDKKKVEILAVCLNSLEKISSTLKAQETQAVMEKNIAYFALLFPAYIIKCIYYYPALSLYFLRLAMIFYKSLFNSDIFNRTRRIAHCELYPDSILYDEKTEKICIIDWEGALISDRLYDLALVGRYYFEILDEKNLHDLIYRYLNNKKDAERFLALSICSTVEYLSRLADSRLVNPSQRYLAFVTKLVREFA